MANNFEAKKVLGQAVETMKRAPEVIRGVGRGALTAGREILASRDVGKQLLDWGGAMVAFPAFKKLPEAGRSLLNKNPTQSISALADGIGKTIGRMYLGPLKLGVASVAAAASLIMLPANMSLKAGKTAQAGVGRVWGALVKTKDDMAATGETKSNLPPPPAAAAYQAAASSTKDDKTTS